MTLAAVLIVRNEEDCIQECLNSLKGIDEIVILDTGSEDQTAQRISELAFPNLRYHAAEYAWNDDFAEARNEALNRCSADWILSIDADHRLISSIADVMTEIASAEQAGCNAIDIQSQEGNWRTVLWKNLPSIRWVGEAHESLYSGQNILHGLRGSLKREVLYSPAHKRDPDRYIRILSKQVAINPDHARNLYYLAREYWYRKDFDTAGKLFVRCVQHSKFRAEKADAWLYIARIFWIGQCGDEAREACARALIINANFKEAHRLMAEMSFPENKKAWTRFASAATNQEVLFIRG